MEYCTKCMNEVKTKFNSVYIKPHAYKSYITKCSHISIENIEVEVLIKPKDDDY